MRMNTYTRQKGDYEIIVIDRCQRPTRGSSFQKKHFCVGLTNIRDTQKCLREIRHKHTPEVW